MNMRCAIEGTKNFNSEFFFIFRYEFVTYLWTDMFMDISTEKK